MESEKRYGEYEMVNGGVVNDLRDRLNALEAERERLRAAVIDALDYHIVLNTRDVCIGMDVLRQMAQALKGGNCGE